MVDSMREMYNVGEEVRNSSITSSPQEGHCMLKSTHGTTIELPFKLYTHWPITQTPPYQ